MVEIFFDPTASATAYGQRPKFVRAEHSATAEGENCAYGPTLTKVHTVKSKVKISQNSMGFTEYMNLYESTDTYIYDCAVLHYSVQPKPGFSISQFGP